MPWKHIVPSRLVTFLASLFIARAILIVVYRLYFHPLARFPGPKLAASTRLYEFYYEVIRYGKFPGKILEMHERYGSVVRISQEELSINDTTFNFDHFFKDRNLGKDHWYYNFGYSHAIVAVLDKVKHKTRQTHLAHHFGGAYFQQNAFPIIATEVFELSQKIKNSVQHGEPFDLTTELRRMCNEVLRNFLLGDKSWKSADSGHQARPDQIPLFQAISAMRQFPFLKTVQTYMPLSIIDKWVPMAKYANEANVGVRKLINEYDNSSGFEKTKQTGVLYRLVEAEPAYRAENCSAAMEEYMELLWGGREAVSSAIVQICYRLLLHPQYTRCLHEELVSTKIDLETATYSDLQKLPLLHGICKEGIRLTWGGAFRMPRTSPLPVVYKEWHIPANTPISMSPNFAHQDPAIFESPSSFKPERWIGADAAKLENYWRPFVIGSRGCQGRNMAIEIIWRSIANIFSAYKIEWSGCDEKSIWNDGSLKVFPPKSAQGLIVTATEW